MINIEKLIIAHLREIGADGLCDFDCMEPCGCSIDDLAPCVLSVAEAVEGGCVPGWSARACGKHHGWFPSAARAREAARRMETDAATAAEREEDHD